MDIFSAFYNIPLSEKSRDLTTFTAPDGLRYRYRRCPFGLNNSPSQLNLILGNLFSDKSRFHSLASYADDLAIYSCDWKSHLQQPELTLRILQAVRLSCNPRKTEIVVSEIEYLGYRMSGDTVRMSKKRIQVINDILAPKKLQSAATPFEYVPVLEKTNTVFFKEYTPYALSVKERRRI